MDEIETNGEKSSVEMNEGEKNTLNLRVRAGVSKYGLRRNPRKKERLFNTELTHNLGILKKETMKKRRRMQHDRRGLTFEATVRCRNYCKTHHYFDFEGEKLVRLKDTSGGWNKQQRRTLAALKLFPSVGGMSRSEYLHLIQVQDRRTICTK